MLQTIGVFSVAAVFRSARGLNVGGVPGLGANRAQKSRRMKGTCTNLHIERLQDHATLRGPELLQGQDQILEARGGGGRNCRSHGVLAVGAQKEGLL